MDQSLLAAPHGLSQRATSFIASWRQGIRQTPFFALELRPRTSAIAPSPAGSEPRPLARPRTQTAQTGPQRPSKAAPARPPAHRLTRLVLRSRPLDQTLTRRSARAGMMWSRVTSPGDPRSDLRQLNSIEDRRLRQAILRLDRRHAAPPDATAVSRHTIARPASPGFPRKTPAASMARPPSGNAHGLSPQCPISSRIHRMRPWRTRARASRHRRIG